MARGSRRSSDDVESAAAVEAVAPAAAPAQVGVSGFQEKLNEGWKSLAIKAGEVQSRHVDYDPATWKMELGEERWGAGGQDFAEGEGEDLPEVEVAEDGSGGWAQMAGTVGHDVTLVYKLVGEIRK